MERYDFENFKSTENGNSFTDVYTDILYFSINYNSDLPSIIKDTVYSMIKDMIMGFEIDNYCTLDINALILDARLECYIDSFKEIRHSINISIMSEKDYKIEVLINKEYIVLKDDPIYNDFKAYFMKALELELFMK